MDAIDRLHRSENHTLADWERDPRQIQLAILEELTLMRKALQIALTGRVFSNLNPSDADLAEAIRAGKERLLEAVKGEGNE